MPRRRLAAVICALAFVLFGHPLALSGQGPRKIFVDIKNSYDAELFHLSGSLEKLPNVRIIGSATTQMEQKTIWRGPDDVLLLPPGPLAMTIESSSLEDDVGMTGVEFAQVFCLDADHLPIESAVIELQGTIPQSIGISCLRIVKIVGMDPNDVKHSNVGDLSVKNGGVTYGFAPAGIGGSRTAAHTVIAGTVSIVRGFTVLPGPDNIVITTVFLAPGIAPQRDDLPLDGAPHSFPSTICLPEKTDFSLEVRNGNIGGSIEIEVEADIIPMVKPGGQCP